MGGVVGVASCKRPDYWWWVVGRNAAQVAMGMVAKVVIMDKSIARLREIDDRFGSSVVTLFATLKILKQQLKNADVVIGAVLIPGAAAPKVHYKNQLQLMKAGSVDCGCRY